MLYIQGRRTESSSSATGLLWAHSGRYMTGSSRQPQNIRQRVYFRPKAPPPPFITHQFFLSGTIHQGHSIQINQLPAYAKHIFLAADLCNKLLMKTDAMHCPSRRCAPARVTISGQPPPSSHFSFVGQNYLPERWVQIQTFRMIWAFPAEFLSALKVTFGHLSKKLSSLWSIDFYPRHFF